MGIALRNLAQIWSRTAPPLLLLLLCPVLRYNSRELFSSRPPLLQGGRCPRSSLSYMPRHSTSLLQHYFVQHCHSNNHFLTFRHDTIIYNKILPSHSLLQHFFFSPFTTQLHRNIIS